MQQTGLPCRHLSAQVPSCLPLRGLGALDLAENQLFPSSIGYSPHNNAGHAVVLP